MSDWRFKTSKRRRNGGSRYKTSLTKGASTQAAHGKKGGYYYKKTGRTTRKWSPTKQSRRKSQTRTRTKSQNRSVRRTKAVLHALNISPKDVDALFNAADKDGNKVLDRDEFQNLMLG